MAQALKADDLMPLIDRLSQRQRRLLALRLLRDTPDQAADKDADRYAAQPVQPDEAGGTTAGVAFDPDGWDEFYAAR